MTRRDDKRTEAKPSDRLRYEDNPAPGTSGQFVPKLDKKAARKKEQMKKSKFRLEKTDKKLTAARDKLSAKKRKKPPGIGTALLQEGAAAVHNELREAERDNSDLQAAHAVELAAETAVTATAAGIKRRIATRPARTVKKLERKNINANVDYTFRQMAQEQPELQENAYKRHFQKKRLKHEYKKQARDADTGGEAPTPPSSKLRQESAEPKPSDRLRYEDTPGDPADLTSGQIVPKLDKKAAREVKRIEKSIFRVEKTEKKFDKAKEKLSKQKPYKPLGLVKTLSRALGHEVWRQAHGEVSKYERDNVGLEAAHSLEQGAEGAWRQSSRFVKHRMRTRPKRQAVKWQRKNIKAKADYQFRQMAQEHPELKRNVFKKHIQKRRLKKQYQKQAKQAAKQAAKAARQTAGAAQKTTRNLIGFVARHPVAAVVIALLFLIVFSLQSCMSGALTIGGGIGGGIGGTSYLAEDSDINLAELRYTEWETDLLLSAKNAAAARPGYDEYRYSIGNIGHNPFELLAFLTAVYDDFTYSGVESVLQEIFNQQYTLTYTATTEQRGSGEGAYDVSVLTITLTARSFSDVIAPRITTQEQRERYGVYMFLKGNRQYVGTPFDMEWLPYVSSYYGYRVSPTTGAKDYHTGVDIALPTGTEILAGGAGVVLVAGNGGNYGLTVLVDYGKGITARYAHCSALRVSAGQTVGAGDVIALVGNTGNSTGAHLHIEVLKNGEFINPLYYVDGTQGDNAPVFGTPGAAMGDGSYAALIAEAEKYIGMPYVFGGSTPSTSFDCSGYICWIFTHSGVRNLPRTTAQGIYNQCTPISASEAKPGDLVFFHTTYSTPDTVTHIGLYVGGGMMLHCGNPIGYTSINTTYWQQHFYSFGRLS